MYSDAWVAVSPQNWTEATLKGNLHPVGLNIISEVQHLCWLMKSVFHFMPKMLDDIEV